MMPLHFWTTEYGCCMKQWQLKKSPHKPGEPLKNASLFNGDVKKNE